MTFETIFDLLVCYHKELRQPLFVSGFTIASFLFSMKASILTTLKKDVYDTKEHQSQIAQRIKKRICHESAMSTEIKPTAFIGAEAIASHIIIATNALHWVAINVN